MPEPCLTCSTRRDPVRRSRTRCRPAARRRFDDRLDVSRARPAIADRRLAPARARPGARRPDPDVVAVDARSSPAAYYGAMHARLVLVPLDLRMSSDAVAGRSSGPRARATSSWAPVATRRIPREAGLDGLPDDHRRGPRRRAGDDDPAFPPDWEARQAAWTRPDARRGLRAHLHLAGRPARRRA